MKTIKGVSDFSNAFSFYNHSSFDTVKEVSPIRDCIINVLTNCDHIVENLQIKV